MDFKLLISCPACQERGVKMNLAQVLPDGRIAVRRFDENSTTVIGGKDMFIQCGHCGSTAFRREGQYAGTILHHRIEWFHREQAGGTPGTLFAGSN